MELISLLMIANIVVHLGPFLGLFLRSTNMLKFMLITDVLITLANIFCCPISAIIWGFMTYVDWKEHGYIFRG